VLKDIDGDGLNDIELKNSKWLGYSSAAGKPIEKTAPASSSAKPLSTRS
jgi:hypothetical protein